mgnify:CR=1 FL=1
MSASVPNSEWTCGACAFNNKQERRDCQLCGTTRCKRQAIVAPPPLVAAPAKPSAVSAVVSSRSLAAGDVRHPPGMIIEIVGTAGIDRGRSCEEHKCCGSVLREDVVVRIRKEQILVPDFISGMGTKKERTALTVNWVSDGIDRCRVGFLPHAYVAQGKMWDGVLCQVVEVIEKNDPSQARRAKHHANKGYAKVAVISQVPMGVDAKPTKKMASDGLGKK